jgi:hypothetical protein
MLAKTHAIYADLIGEDGLVDHVPDHLRMGQYLAFGATLNVAEGIETKFDLLRHQFVSSIP